MFEDFDLDSIIEQTTKPRVEATETAFEEVTDFSGLDFDEAPEAEITPTPKEPDTPPLTIHKITEKEAREGATILIELINTVNKAGLTKLAAWKVRKKRVGSKEVLAKYLVLFEKNEAGEELTPEEKKQLWKYNAYIKEKESLEDTIPFTDEEKEMLINSCTKYFKDKNISLGGQNSFFIELAILELTKVLAIITI